MGSCRKVENGPVLKQREREMSEGRSHWIQHQDINTADRSLLEWFNKNNSRASTPLSDFSAIIRKKSL